jgi:hypothetical protein
MGSFWVVIGLECPSSLDNFAYRTAASSSTRPGDAEPRSGVHQLPELVEQISAPVSGLDLVLHRVRKRHFDHFTWKVGVLTNSPGCGRNKLLNLAPRTDVNYIVVSESLTLLPSLAGGVVFNKAIEFI